MGSRNSQLVLPGRKRLPGKVDHANRGLAEQVLNLLQKGYRENLWPSYVREYLGAGLQNDLGVVYHHLAFSSSRGYVLGLKSAEAAIRRAVKEIEDDLRTAQEARDRELARAGPTPDDSVQRLKGAERCLERLHEILDRQKVPGV